MKQTFTETQEWTDNFNKKCSEFMGYFKKDGQLPNVWWKFTGISYQPVFEDNEMKFHSDWNWIMEVVTKIESLPGIKQFHIVSDSAYMNGGLNIGVYQSVEGKRVATIQAIDQFITWYNEQKK